MYWRMLGPSINPLLEGYSSDYFVFSESLSPDFPLRLATLLLLRNQSSWRV